MIMFLENLEKLLQNSDVKKTKIEINAGLGYGTFHNLFVKKTKPSSDILIKLADYFGVSIDYLVGRETPPESPVFLPKGMSQEFVDNWNKLSRFQQQRIMGRVEAMLDDEEVADVKKG